MSFSLRALVMTMIASAVIACVLAPWIRVLNEMQQRELLTFVFKFAIGIAGAFAVLALLSSRARRLAGGVLWRHKCICSRPWWRSGTLLLVPISIPISLALNTASGRTLSAAMVNWGISLGLAASLGVYLHLTHLRPYLTLCERGILFGHPAFPRQYAEWKAVQLLVSDTFVVASVLQLGANYRCDVICAESDKLQNALAQRGIAFVFTVDCVDQLPTAV